MTKRAILLAALLAGCSSTPPELLPPPFGPDGPGPARLFFPSSLAATPEGVLLVANGNFNHLYDGGTIVGISRTFLDSVFRLGLDCGIANRDARCAQDIPGSEFTGAAMIGNYAGPLTLDSAATAAYTGSRDSGLLNAITIDRPGGVLHCAPGAGDDARKDCRKGLINLKPSGVDGPYSIVAGNAVIPGKSTAQSVLFVSSIIPHIEAVNSGVIDTSTWVAALDMADPSQVLFRVRVGLSPFVAGGSAPGPMVFDPVRRQLYLAGCYQRSASFGAGEPGTGICFGIGTNYLRIVNVDSGEAADPVIVDLHSDVLSIYTTQLLLADPDAVTGAPTTLWATMRGPDALVRIELPAIPSIGPRVRQVIPLPASPADMVRIDRGSASSLLAITAEKLNAVTIVDTATNAVVTQVDRLGDSPFAIQEISCPSENTGSACLAAAVFGECSVALIEVPKGQPEQSKLRGLVGKCAP